MNRRAGKPPSSFEISFGDLRLRSEIGELKFEDKHRAGRGQRAWRESDRHCGSDVFPKVDATSLENVPWVLLLRKKQETANKDPFEEDRKQSWQQHVKT